MRGAEDRRPSKTPTTALRQIESAPCDLSQPHPDNIHLIHYLSVEVRS